MMDLYRKLFIEAPGTNNFLIGEKDIPIKEKLRKLVRAKNRVSQKEYIYLDVSNSLAILLNKNSEEIKGKGLRELYPNLPETEVQKAETRYTNQIAKGSEEFYDQQIIFQDGSIHHFRVHTKVISDNGKKIIFGSSKEITEILNLQSQLKEQNNEINCQNEELISINEMLSTANELLEKEKRSKEDLIKIMAHDIRNPLSTIVQFLEIWDNIQDPGIKNKLKGQVIEKTKKIFSFINDVLESSKLGVAGIVPKKQDINRVGFVQELAEYCDDFLQKEKTEYTKLQTSKNTIIEIQSGFEELFVDCLSDELYLKSIFTNFLSNAIKFTDEGKVSLQGSIVEENDKQRIIRFEVKDTGCGIAPEDLPKLFKEFSNDIPKTSYQASQSTGLGLSIVKTTIEKAFKGTVEVKSRVGEGTSFIFQIPFEKKQ